MKISSVILGMAAAAVVGAAVGMLIAPEKGSDLQKRLKDEANKWIDEVRKLVGNARELAEGTKDEAEEEIERIKSNLKPIQD